MVYLHCIYDVLYRLYSICQYCVFTVLYLQCEYYLFAFCKAVLSPLVFHQLCVGCFLYDSWVCLRSSLLAGALSGPELLSTGLSGRYAAFLWMKITKAVAVPAPLFSAPAGRRGRIKLPPVASVPRPVCHGTGTFPFSVPPFALSGGALQAAFAA